MTIRGFLIDMNGVLYVGSQLIEGAQLAVDYLQVNKIPHLFLTNTTTKTVQALAQELNDKGLKIEEELIYSTITAAKVFLNQKNIKRIYPVLREEVLSEFAEFEIDTVNPQAILIGDIGDRWNYNVMNTLFHYVLNGAQIIALHKGKYWREEDGLRLDIGAFIAGLEYATNTNAAVIGKPSKTFFQMAVEMLKLSPQTVAMIGDDIDSDIGGAKQIGMIGILVRTGKFREEVLYQSSVLPDVVIESIAQLPKLWEKYGSWSN